MSSPPIALRHATWRVSGLDCPDCAQTLSRAVELIPGVECAELNYASGLLLIDFALDTDPRPDVVATVLRGGYGLTAEEGAGAAETITRSAWARHRTAVAVIGAGVMSVVGWLFSLPAASGAMGSAADWLSIGSYLAAVAFGLIILAPRALTSLRARLVDMNALMIVAVTGAIALGEFAEAAAVVFLFAVGGWLESRAVERTRGIDPRADGPIA